MAESKTPKASTFSLAQRLTAARILLGSGLLLGMLISLRLWLTTRTFPHLPCFKWLPPFPAPWDGLLLVVLFAALVLYLCKPRLTWPLAAVLAVSLLLALQDQVRWQPWFYLYLLGLCGFLVVKPGAGKTEQRALLALIQFMLIAMYFWSGFHKLGPGFPNLHDAAFINPLQDRWPAGLLNLLARTRGAVPWIEMATALALLIPLTRKAGVVVAISTHLLILLLVGPLGTNNNYVIWPWNIVMAVLVVVVFWGPARTDWRATVITRLRYVAIPVVILLGIMPAFSPGVWDRYLSFHLYSGHEQRVMLVIHKQLLPALPERYHPYLSTPGHAPDMRELNLRNWAYAELEVPFPAEARMNLAVAKELAALPLPEHSGLFFYFDYEYLLKERGWDRFSAKEMLEMNRFPAPPLRFGNPTSK